MLLGTGKEFFFSLYCFVSLPVGEAEEIQKKMLFLYFPAQNNSA